MKIAIIGAGPTGLISEKYALEQGYECVVYEQAGVIGGTWVYTDKTGVDENGLPIHSALYKDLKTNLPKEVMTFLDFPYPEQRASYITHPEVLAYFNSFADRFDLREHIKFYRYVTKIELLPDEIWTVTSLDARTMLEETASYNAVFVCAGHYRYPILPEIPGQDLFEGFQLHSHDFRTSELYTDKRVLIIGAGPSGQDISRLIANVAKHVYISHRGSQIVIQLPSNVTEKTAVQSFDKKGAIFNDDTREDVDIIMYCTGYKYLFPFLSDSCQIKTDDNWVRPLYKHIVNIQHPTMFFIGLPFSISVIPMFDIQARFALAVLGRKFALPSREDMQKELDESMQKKKDTGVPVRHAHKMGGGKEQTAYFEDLANTAGIRKIPSVINKLYGRVRSARNLEECFKIIDDENFIQIA